MSIKSLVKKVIFWRHESYFFHSGIFTPERIPNLSKEEVIAHELSNYKLLYDFLSKNEYKSDAYYKQLLEFFSKDKKTLNNYVNT